MYRVYKILFILVGVVVGLTLFASNNVTKAVDPQLAIFRSFGVSSAVINNYDKINELFVKYPCLEKSISILKRLHFALLIIPIM